MTAVVMWDWHGVLGVERYWQRPTRHRQQLRRLQSYIYSDAARMADWMRGHVTTRELATSCGAHVPDSVLVDQLYAGWPQRSYMNLPLLAAVQQIWPQARHWIVTDNVDVFTPWLSSQAWFTGQFAGVTNSADHRVLKRDPHGLLEIALEAAKATAAHAVLLDDSAQNCEAFRALGSNTIHIPTWTRNA